MGPAGFVGSLDAAAEHVPRVGHGTQPPTAPTVRAPDTGRQLEAAGETARRQGLAPGAGARCGQGPTLPSAGRGVPCLGAAGCALGFSLQREERCGQNHSAQQFSGRTGQ